MKILSRLIPGIVPGYLFRIAQVITGNHSPIAIIKNLVSNRRLLGLLSSLSTMFIDNQMMQAQAEINLAYSRERIHNSHMSDPFRTGLLIFTTYAMLMMAFIVIIFYGENLSYEVNNILYILIGILISCIKDISVKEFGSAL